MIEGGEQLHLENSASEFATVHHAKLFKRSGHCYARTRKIEICVIATGSLPRAFSIQIKFKKFLEQVSQPLFPSCEKPE
jgi:hypothetical protein